jgi:phenylacetic acid degradation operon negative regulatory protein
VAPGLWIAPGNLASEISPQLERAGLADYVDLFQGAQLMAGEIRHKVGQWWDLPALDALYADFIELNRPVLDRWEQCPSAPGGGQETLRQAFVDYVPLVTQWRRLPYMDPGLAEEYLPKDWSGLEAEALFIKLRELLGQQAESYAHSILRRP